MNPEGNQGALGCIVVALMFVFFGAFWFVVGIVAGALWF